MTTLPEINIYTDGSCQPNPGKGGWAFVLVLPDGKKIVKSGGKKETTNNQMELQSAIEALKEIRHEKVKINIFTDSTYLRNGVTSWIPKWKALKWKKVDGGIIANIAMWQEIDALVSKKPVFWHWVKGHASNDLNNLADQLAQAAVGRL